MWSGGRRLWGRMRELGGMRRSIESGDELGRRLESVLKMEVAP